MKCKNSSYKKFAAISLLLCGEISVNAEPLPVVVEPQMQYNASGRDDIKLIRQYFREASWETPISNETWAMLKPIGVSKARLINVESSKSLSINPRTKELQFDFSSLLTSLNNCKNYSLIPHIVVGHVPQINLAVSKKNTKYYGVSDWSLYEKYAYAFLEFVTVKNGFLQADFEVSNEPDINGASWLVEDSLANGDPKMYAAYINLYRAWTNAADKLSHNHPEIKLRIGGPAITPYSYGFGKLNWAEQFLNDIAAQHLRLDFFSFHFYGDQQALTGLPEFGKYPPISKHINALRNKLNVLGLNDTPLYMTEWAPSSVVNETPKGIINGNNIGSAWMARFLMDSAENNVDEGSLLVFRDNKQGAELGILTNNWGWGSLLLSDGVTPKAIYNVALMFGRLPGQRVKAIPARQGSIGIIAGADASKVSVLAYNQNWDFPNNRELAHTEQVRIVVKDLPFGASTVRVSCYLVDESHGNPHYLHKNAAASLKTAKLQAISTQVTSIVDGVVNLAIDLEPSSVALWEITAI